jgi:hypothetical protein
MADGKHLIAIARHFRKTQTLTVASVKEVLEKAISSGDNVAVMECLVLAIERHEPQQYPLIETVFAPAIEYLIGRLDQRIASEQRSAEQESELRKRRFEAGEEPES